MKGIIYKYKELLNHPLDDVDINQIMVYLENRQIKKLHFEYGTTVLLISLRHCEEIEDYFSCSAIKSFLEQHNKYSKEPITEWNLENILKKLSSRKI